MAYASVGTMEELLPHLEERVFGDGLGAKLGGNL